MTDPSSQPSSQPSPERTQPKADLLDRITKGIAHELHDGPVQWIVGAKMLCESLQMKAAKGTAISPDQLDPILAALQRALLESRQIMQGLDGIEVQNGHWFDALQEDLALTRSTLSEEDTPEIIFDVDPSSESLPCELAQTLYRILREAIWNALRHSHGKQILCRTWQDTHWLHAEVSDDGVGIDSAANKEGDRYEGHWGLRSIHYRAEEAGGRASLTSEKVLPEQDPAHANRTSTNHGTRWEISLPLGPPTSP